MEENMNHLYERQCKLDRFAYVSSIILFEKKQKQAKTVWKPGRGLEAIDLKRKLMYSTLINVQRNSFDQFIDDDIEEASTERRDRVWKESIEGKEPIEAKDNTSDDYSTQSNSSENSLKRSSRRPGS